MYGDFLKTQEAEISKPPSEPEPVITAPSTTKKKGPGFGRSNGKVVPLRADAVPELSQVYSELAKKDRRSHGTFFSQNESHEWGQHTNNTIPETLNSSREWKLPSRSNFSSSQNDLRAISESTPMKTSQQHYFDGAPVSMDKENFYTPRKTSEAFAASTPAARCPLSVLPVDGAPLKDAVDGVKPLELQPNNGGTGILGSTWKTPLDCDLFRTPQCKTAPNHQNSNSSSGAVRQRLYGVSTTKILSNIPLHPAVAAGQQQRVVEQQSRTSRKLTDPTPLITTPALVGKQNHMDVGTVQATAENQPYNQEGVCPASNSRLLHSRTMETNPFKEVPNVTCAPLKQVAVQPTAFSSEKTPLASLMATEDSASSTWLPHPKISSCTPYSAAPVLQKTDSTNQRQCQEIPFLQSEPPSSKRKLETEDLVESILQPNVSKQQQKVSPVREMKQLQSTPELPETAKVDSCVPRTTAHPPSSDSKCPPLPPINSVELSSKKMESSIPVVQEPVRYVECQPQQASKISEVPVVKVTSPAESVKTVGVVPKTSSPGCGEIVVNGHIYPILSLLGRGGSSKVFQVLDPENSQLKAVKCVNLADTDQSICDGYLNEIRLLAELQDGESVIRMFDHEHKKDKRLLLVVMEKGDIDLSNLIKGVNKSKKISAAMIVYYWTEMLNAVSFIHKRGTIHSDLKPANFLLVSGRLKLIDFGIASSVQEDMTSVVKESLTGTYNYISPEALSATSTNQGYKISYKSDVWSLGCILYSLVYGRTPFQHITGQFQKLNAIVNPNHKIEFPEPPVEGCPSAIIQAMKSCLVRNPKERASVDELLQLHYLEQAGPERVILSQFANLAASVGIVHETEDNRYAVVIRALQRLIIDNERNLPFLGRKR